MIRDPVQRMLSQRDDNRTGNLIRNKLQLHARNLITKGHQLAGKTDLSVNEAQAFIGEINGYIGIRNELRPWVAADGYCNELKRVITKLQSKLSC
jgi:hypothetical protein